MPNRAIAERPASRRVRERLGAHIRARRLSLGLTQTRLAARSEISQPTISRIERGLAPGIRLDRLVALLVMLNVRDLRFE